MFIYKVTNTETNKSYIGVDTKPKHKNNRWNYHKNNCTKYDTKFYKMLRNNLENCTYEIIYESNNVYDLFLKEIEYINKYDSYYDGYNSTQGGDCFGGNVVDYLTIEYEELQSIFRERMRIFNEFKWKGLSVEQRKEKTSHLHTEEVYLKKAKSIKNYWNTIKEKEKNTQLRGIRNFYKDENNKEKIKERNIQSSLKAAEKNKTPVIVEDINGNKTKFSSITEAKKIIGIDISHALKKTRQNKRFKGYFVFKI